MSPHLLLARDISEPLARLHAMDGLTEKKWFVYLGDHHEGPFSIDELQGKLTAGQVSTTQYVWCDGMTDWKLMSEVDVFEKLRAAIPVPPPTLGAGATFDRTEPSFVADPNGGSKKIHLTAIRGGAPAADAERPSAERQGQEALSPESLLTPASTPSLPTETPRAAPVAPKKVTAVTPTTEAARKRRRPSFGFMGILVVVLLLMGGGLAFLSGQADWLAKQPWLLRLPIVGEMLSPIPLLDDVSQEDFDELRLAATATEGSRSAVVLSQSDPFAPIFYAATNAPDGTELTLRLEGVADTLLNETQADYTVKTTLIKRFARFDPVRTADGKSIARGTYKVSLINGDQALASKSIFLGGVKDATYLARLKEFHDKVWEKAVTELTELKQFSATLDEQLAITNKSFADVNRRHQRGNPAAKREWDGLAKKWTGLQAQLAETFNQWTPEALKTDYFYGDLRAQVQSLGQQISALNQLQTNFYVSKETAAEVEPQIVIAMQTTQSFSEKLAKTLDDLNAAVATRATALPPRTAPAAAPTATPGATQ